MTAVGGKFGKTLTLPAGVIVDRALLSVKRPVRKLGKPVVEHKPSTLAKPTVQTPAPCEQIRQNEPPFQVGPTTADFAALYEPKPVPKLAVVRRAIAMPAKPARIIHDTRLPHRRA